jgi:putative SOS response-associated peptidase YedK
MCGRVRLSSDVSEIKLVFSIPPHRPTPNFPSTWNGAPTDLLPVVRYDAKVGERSLDLLRWGLVPYWAKDLKVGFANINAKAEGIENKPAFRDAFQRRRCLVPVDNFYEWKKTSAGKQPYAIALADRGLMALAGLWENWKSPAGEWVRSHRHHDAQRAMRRAAQSDAGGPCPRDVAGLARGGAGRTAGTEGLVCPVPVGGCMTCWPVSARVGNVKNNDPSLIEPIAAE